MARRRLCFASVLANAQADVRALEKTSHWEEKREILSETEVVERRRCVSHSECRERTDWDKGAILFCSPSQKQPNSDSIVDLVIHQAPVPALGSHECELM